MFMPDESVQNHLDQNQRNDFISANMPLLALLQRCGEHLGAVLSGREDPRAVLFPDGNLDAVGRVYQDTPQSRYYNEVMAAALKGLVDALPLDSRLSVLEIGAGTGGSTGALLPLLPGDRCRYVFTDMSPLFFARARDVFGAYPFVEYKILDISRDTASQGFSAGEFDVIVCANVLHATSDLMAALRNLRVLLAGEGLLLLREITLPRPALGFDISFGCLLEPLSDTAFRHDNPFLTPQAWSTALQEAGFAQVACYPDSADTAFDEHIILGRNAAGGRRTAFSERCAVAAGTAPPVAQPGQESGHPLLGVRLSTPLDIAQYESVLSVKRQPFLGQHQVFNIVVVPGTAHFDLAAAAGMNFLGSDHVILEEVVLREALMLDSDSRTLQVLLTPKGTGAEFQIFSQSRKDGQSGGDWHLHVSGALSAPPFSGEEKAVDLEQLRSRCPEVVDIAAYYEKFDAFGAVQYGPAFRGLRRLWRSQGEAVAEVDLDRRAAGGNEGFVIHPAVLDSCLQSMVAALATREKDIGGDGFMPFGVERVVFYGRASEKVWCHAVMKPGDSFQQDMFSASFKIYSPEGRLLCEIVNLTMKKTSRETLEFLKIGQQQYSDLLYDVVWRPALPPSQDGARSGSWLIFASLDTPLATRLAASLEAEGRPCTLVAYRTEGAPAGARLVDPRNPADFDRLLSDWLAQEHQPAGVAFLWGLDCASPDFTGKSDETLFKTLTAEAVLHLIQALGRHQQSKKLRFALLTCQAQAVRETDMPLPAQSLLWGLEKSIANELGFLDPLIVDLDQADGTEAQLAGLHSLLLARDYREDKIAFRAGALLAPRLVRSRPGKKAPAALPLLRPDSEAFALEFAKNGIENMQIAAVERREPAADEVEIHVDAYGMNFQNVMVAMGFVKHIQTMVLDCAGTVSAVGSAVTEFRPGDRVLTTAYGPFASHVYARASLVAKVPETMSAEDAASIPTVFMTAWHALVEAGQLQKGGTVLLHSASGGVGLAAIQVARAQGADIIATAGTERKRAILRSQGIRHVFSSRSTDFEQEVHAATAGRGVDVVLNFLTKELADSGMRCLKSGGCFVEIGKTDIRTPDQVAAIRGDIAYRVVDLEKMGQKDENQLRRIFRQVMQGFAAGIYKPIQRRLFTMDAAAEAFRYMLAGRHIGKVVVKNTFVPRNAGIRPDACYLVTGGFSEVGLALAAHLAGQGAKRIWLLGRRLPQAGSPQEQALSTLAAKGCTVEPVQVDVTDRTALAEFFQNRIQANPWPLAGVFHLAGLLDDDTLPKLDWARFNRVLAPKVDGSWYLHELSRELPLDHFVVFSSIASIFGTHGQANHVAANTFMDALIAARRADFLPGLTVNWGAWGDIGTVVRLGILDRIRQQGVEGFNTATGMAVLDHLMAGTDQQKVVVQMDWNRMLPILQVSAGAAMYAEIRPAGVRTAAPAGGPSGSAQEAPGQLAAELRTLPMLERVQALRAYLKKEIAGFLRISEDAIPDEVNLTSLGMDSLISLDLFQRLSRALKIRIAPHEISAAPTVAAMADKFARDLGPDPEEAHSEGSAETAAANSLAALYQPAPAEACQPFPLSDMQQAYWLGRNQNGMPLGGVSCHFYFEAEAEGLDLDRYEAAWNVLIRRQPMLRTVILDGERQQVLASAPAYAIRRHNLRAASAAGVEAAISRLREEMSHEMLDMSHWPNFRIEVSELPDGLMRMHFSIDLMLCDFHGISLMLNELGRIYAGEEAQLPRLELSFRDYRLAEERYRTTPAYARDREYWLKRLDTLPPAPKLPLEAASTSMKQPRFRRKMAVLDRETWERLKSRGEVRGFTPTAVTLGAFAEVLGFWSEDPAFTLNITLFHRLPVHPQVNALVGEFTSNTLLAVDLKAGDTFAARSGQIWRDLWSDMEHRSFSGIRVLRELGRRRGTAAGIMPVVFTSTLAMESKAGAFALGNLGHEVFSISQTPQVWLDHQLFEIDHELRLVFDYVDGLFPDGLIDDMFETYVAALKRLASEDDAWNAAVLPQLPDHQVRVRENVNATRRVLPDCLMFEPFLNRAQECPDAAAVITDSRTLSYGEVERLSRAGALRLRSEGLKPGDRIALFMEKGWEQVVAVLAVQRAGGAYLPLDVHQPEARIQEILEDAGVRLVLGQERLSDRINWAPKLRFLAVDRFAPATASQTAPESGAGPQDLAYLIYTSGSTGRPKGVMMTHAAAMNTVLDVNRRYDVGPADRMLAVARLSFDLSVYDIFGPLSAGGALVMPAEEDALNPDAWLRLVRTHQVTLWNTVPALGQILADVVAQDKVAVQLRLMIFSGDWIPRDLPSRMARLLPGVQVVAMGGATEAAIWSNAHETGPEDRNWPSIPYGRPLSNQGFAVLDWRLAPRPDWVPGDLYITGKGLAPGYWHDEEKTRNSFLPADATHPRMYRTGDTARYHADGVLEFLGRKDTQVKIHGYRVELGEIEATLKRHPAVANAAVVLGRGRNDELALSAYVEVNRAHAGLVLRQEDGERQLTPSLLSHSESSEWKGVEGTRFLPVWENMTELYIAAVSEAFEELGLFTNRFVDSDDFMRKSDISPRYYRWVKRALRALADRGVIVARDEGRWLVGTAPALENVLSVCRNNAHELGYSSGEIELLERTVHNLSSILREDLHSAELYTSDALPGFYQKIFDLSNRVAVAIVNKAVRTAGTRRPYRILEVGAGYGTVTQSLLPLLPPDTVRYDFTDISEFFLNRAAREFHQYPFVEYRQLDLNGQPELAGFALHSYDLIFAGNVLHDVVDIRKTLTSLARLLRPAGLLVMQEETVFQLPFDLTMGLQQGFDSAGDTEFRPEHPLLSRDMWSGALEKAGFSEPKFALPASSTESALGLDVLVCEGPATVSHFEPQVLTRFLSEHLPEYMIPATFHLLDRLPLNANGKVDRKKLKAAEPITRRDKNVGIGPRTPNERIVADIWRDVLHVEHIGVTESFFLSGGDSLSAFHLLKRLQDHFQRQLSLKDILQTPTIAAQAALLEQHHGSDSSSSLVKLHGGSSSAAICLAHPIEGLVNAYAMMADAMPEIPFYALQSRGLGGECRPAMDFSTMVEAYLQDISVLEKRGPVLLGGWSMGGFIAWEMACRMESGDAVPLILLDPPSKELWDRQYEERRNDFAALMEQVAPNAEQALAATGLERGVFDRLADEEKIRLFAEGLHSTGQMAMDSAGMQENLRHLLAVGLANVRALARYQPKPQEKRSAVYVRSAGQSDAGVAYWRNLCGGTFTVVQAEGDHWHLLQKPADVARIAASIKAVLAAMTSR